MVSEATMRDPILHRGTYNRRGPLGRFACTFANLREYRDLLSSETEQTTHKPPETSRFLQAGRKDPCLPPCKDPRPFSSDRAVQPKCSPGRTSGLGTRLCDPKPFNELSYNNNSGDHRFQCPRQAAAAIF